MYVNAKITPVEIVPGIGGWEIKVSGGGGEFKYDIFDTFVNATVYPHPAQQ
jgi:hypothetical protein